MKVLKRNILSLMLCILLIVPSTAFATTSDLGHGSGCLHTHVSSCYHQHSSSCYHAHTSTCYQNHTHSTGCYTLGYHNVHNSSSSSSRGVINCDGCGNQWNGVYKISYCYNCSKSGYPSTCPLCGRLCFYADGVSNYVKDCKQLICSTTQDLVCGKSTSTLTCTTSTSTPKCSQSGAYTNCIMPTVIYTLPNQWTNQDVCIDYNGTTAGTLIFTNNSTQSVTVVSTSGHQIQEHITIDKIDKALPNIPEYQLPKGEDVL